MSQDSIGVVITGRSKLQEWKTTQKQNLSRKSRGTLTVKWAGSRDKIFSPSGRGRTFFLTSLFIELIDLAARGFECDRLFATNTCFFIERGFSFIGLVPLAMSRFDPGLNCAKAIGDNACLPEPERPADWRSEI